MNFLADCSRCGRRELRGSRSAHLTPTDHGEVFALTCRGCGSKLVAGTNRVLGGAPAQTLV